VFKTCCPLFTAADQETLLTSYSTLNQSISGGQITIYTAYTYLSNKTLFVRECKSFKTSFSYI